MFKYYFKFISILMLLGIQGVMAQVDMNNNRACQQIQQITDPIEKAQYISKFVEQKYLMLKTVQSYTDASTEALAVDANKGDNTYLAITVIQATYASVQWDKSLKNESFIDFKKLPPYNADLNNELKDCMNKLAYEFDMKKSMEAPVRNTAKNKIFNKRRVDCKKYTLAANAGCNPQELTNDGVSQLTNVAEIFASNPENYDNDTDFCECSPAMKTEMNMSGGPNKAQAKQIEDIYKQELIKKELMKIATQIEMSDFIKKQMNGSFIEQGCSSKADLLKQVNVQCKAHGKEFDVKLIQSIYADLLGHEIQGSVNGILKATNELYNDITYADSKTCRGFNRSSYYTKLAMHSVDDYQFKAFAEIIKELFSDSTQNEEAIKKYQSSDLQGNFANIIAKLSKGKESEIMKILEKNNLLGVYNTDLAIDNILKISDYVSANPVYKMMLANPKYLSDFAQSKDFSDLMEYGFKQSPVMAQNQCDNAVKKISDIACGNSFDVESYRPDFKLLKQKLPDGINLPSHLCKQVDDSKAELFSIAQGDLYAEPDYYSNVGQGDKPLSRFETYAASNCDSVGRINDETEDIRSGTSYSAAASAMARIYGNARTTLVETDDSYEKADVLFKDTESIGGNSNIATNNSVTEKIEFNAKETFVRSAGTVAEASTSVQDLGITAPVVSTPLETPENTLLDNYRKIASSDESKNIEPSKLSSEQKEVFTKLAEDKSIDKSTTPDLSIDEYSRRIANLEKMLLEKEEALRNIDVKTNNIVNAKNIQSEQVHQDATNGISIGINGNDNTNNKLKEQPVNQVQVVNNGMDTGDGNSGLARGSSDDSNPFSSMNKTKSAQGVMNSQKGIALTMEKVKVVDLNNEDVLKEVSEHIKDLISSDFEMIAANYSEGKVKLKINGEEVQVELRKVLDQKSLAELESKLKSSRSVASLAVKDQLEKEIMEIRKAMYKNLVQMSKQLRSSGVLN